MYATILARPDLDPDRTVILESVPFETEDIVEAPFPVEAAAPAQDAALARLEGKLDHAMRIMAAMQQRIESLDATLMRVLMR